MLSVCKLSFDVDLFSATAVLDSSPSVSLLATNLAASLHASRAQSRCQFGIKATTTTTTRSPLPPPLLHTTTFYKGGLPNGRGSLQVWPHIVSDW